MNTQRTTDADAAGSATRRVRTANALGLAACVLAVVCAVAELAAGPGYRLGAWSLAAGIQTIRWAATAAAAAIVLGIVACVLSWRQPARRAAVSGVCAILLGLLIAAPPLILLREGMHLPRIHDISTDTADPPVFVAVVPLRPPGSNPLVHDARNAPLQAGAYPDIQPLRLPLAPADAFVLAERAVRAMRWEPVAVVRDAGRIEATDTTVLFGFKDDIVIRVTAEGAGGSRIDVRSASRLGSSDLGVNAARIRSFLRQLAIEQAKGV